MCVKFFLVILQDRYDTSSLFSLNPIFVCITSYFVIGTTVSKVSQILTDGGPFPQSRLVVSFDSPSPYVVTPAPEDRVRSGMTFRITLLIYERRGHNYLSYL